jgi:apolipoprotein N-acyltransferase
MRLIPVRLWVLAVLSGALQVLPFPIAGPVPVWRTAFCWVALLPLLMALTGKNASGSALSVKQGAWLGYASGFIWYLGNCYWIYRTMHMYGGIAEPAAAGILVLFCLYLGLYHALFGALIAAFRRARFRGRDFGVQGTLLLSPFAWVAVELARARITSLPWDFLGIAQVDNPLLTRLAPITGAYGLSFVIAAVNALWLVRITLKERRHTRTALTLAGVSIVLLYLLFLRRIHNPVHEGTDAVATLVQENLEVGAANIGPQLTTGQMLRQFSELSLYPEANYCGGIPELASTKCVSGHGNHAGAPLHTDLIVWPESPADGFEENNPKFREAMSTLARAANAPIISGATAIDRDTNAPHGYDQYNSAEFIAPDGSFVGRYDKMHLVPFGEYTPYKKLFFFAGSLLQDVGLFDPGKRRTVFAIGGHSYGTFICYESVFADEMREYADLGADVLVNISNDGWYGDTSAAWQHLNMVRMRAIENHRWVLRATNTGVTASIDPYGRVVISAPRHQRTSIRVGFDYEHDVTFYSRHGDLFAYFCALVTAAGLGCSLLRRA